MFDLFHQGAKPGAYHRFEFITPVDRKAYTDFAGSDIVKFSRCRYPYWERPDLMRDIRFGDIYQMPWETISLHRNYLAVTPTNKLRLVKKRIDSFLTVENELIYSELAVRCVAVLAQFITATGYQVAAIVDPKHPKKVTEMLAMLYQAGVIQKSPDDWLFQEQFGDLYHINTKIEEFNRWLVSIGSWEAGMIMGSEYYQDPPGSNAPGATRHGLLMTETLLRALEYCSDMAGFWGEQVLPAGAFYQSVEGEETRKSHGDGALVTQDGKVIIFELIGGSTHSPGYQKLIIEKAASWTAACGASHLDMCVIFLNASYVTSWKPIFRSVNVGVRQEAQKYIANSTLRERGAKKIYVANAAQWFPEKRTIGIDFQRLISWSPIYHCAVDPLLPDPFSSHPDIRFNVVANTMLANHQPTWIYRTRDIPSIERITRRPEKEAWEHTKKIAHSIATQPRHPQHDWLDESGLPRTLRGGGLGDYTQ